jgi:hypothetical protein
LTRAHGGKHRAIRAPISARDHVPIASRDDPEGFSAEKTIELADFNQMTFKAVKPPKKALVW